MTARRQTPARAPTRKPATGKASTRKSATGKAATGKAATGKPAAGKASTRKPATGRAATRTAAAPKAGAPRTGTAARTTASARKRTAPAAKPAAARKGTATSRTRTGRHAAPRPRWRQALFGERPLLAATFAALAVFVAMLLGPLQSFTAASERVDELQSRRVQLATAVEDMEARRARLMDPEHVELRAREELGMVKPGETPYVVTGKRKDVERLPQLLPTAQVTERSWWSRVSGALGKLFDRQAAE